MRKRNPIKAYAIVTGQGRGLLTRNARMPIYWNEDVASDRISELAGSGYRGLYVEPVTVTFSNAEEAAAESGLASTEIEAAAQALVAKLDACEQPITDVFKIYYAKGFTYDGPNYREELIKLRALLPSQR